jgi:hypothetical protein
MEPRSRSTAMIVFGVLLVAGIGVWLWMRAARMDTVSTPDSARPVLAAIPSIEASEAPAAAEGAPGVASSDLPDVAGEAIAPAQGAAQLPALGADTSTGVRPLSAEGERRVDKFLAGLRTSSTDAKDYETLGRSEPADPDWSPRLEALIQQVIERHAREFSRLEISRPRCSKSLCMLTAVATTRNPQQLAQADFQRLVSYMMQETWFRESFFDASTTISTDAAGNVYVSYFIRK